MRREPLQRITFTFFIGLLLATPQAIAAGAAPKDANPLANARLYVNPDFTRMVR